jgi:hypothetical protein
MVASGVATFAHAAKAAAVGGTVGTVAGLAMYTFVGICAGYGIAVNYLFRKKLNQILQDKDGNPPHLHSALLWLQTQIQDRSNSNALKRKWDQFAFRSSKEACRLVRETVTPKFLKQLEIGESRAVERAKWIIQAVKRENAKQIAKHALLLTIMFLGIAAFVCGIVFTTGPWAPLLFSVGAVLWIAIDSTQAHKKLADLLFGKSKIQFFQKSF